MFLGDALPARRHEGLPLRGVPVPERPGPYTRVDSPARREGREGLGVGLGEAQALVGESFEVWRLYPVVAVGAYVVLPQAVQDYQDDGHSRLHVWKIAAP